MALKADRRPVVEHTRYISNAAVPAGYGVILGPTSTGVRGSGQAINDAAPVAILPTGVLTSAKFVGIAVSDVIVLDQTLYPRTGLKSTVQVVGEPYVIGADGEYWTNAISGTPAAEEIAYINTDGTFGNTQVASLPAVGKFKSTKDVDGYALVYIKVA